MIGNYIIDALKRGLSNENVLSEENGRETISAMAKKERKVKGNWEILVVDGPDVNAFCLPGGKIDSCLHWFS